MRSPGTRSSEVVVRPVPVSALDFYKVGVVDSHCPSTRMPTGQEKRDISRRRLIVCSGVSRRRHTSQSTYLQRVHKCCDDAENRDDSDAECIVVIIVDAPKDDTRNLEDVEGMDDLVDEQSTDALALDLDGIKTEDGCTLSTRPSVNSGGNRCHRRPVRVSPFAART